MDQICWIKCYESELMDQMWWIEFCGHMLRLQCYRSDVMDQMLWIDCYGPNVMDQNVMVPMLWINSYGSDVMEQLLWVECDGSMS